MENFGLPSAVLFAGILFFLAGGHKWVEEKIRQLKLDNDIRENELKNKR